MKRAFHYGFQLAAAMALAVLVILGPTGGSLVRGAQTQPKPDSFASPRAAASALIKAARKNDTERVIEILGPATKEWISSGDPVQDSRARERFIAAYEAKNEIDMEGTDTAVLMVGEDRYPFPFPIVKGPGGWKFDPEQGREEVLARRIGENELNTVEVLRAIADAQREYAREDRDGDGLRSYAAHFWSTEGKKDGLYWSTAENEAPSPLGPLIALAAGEGYKARKSPSPDGETRAYHGYRFKLLNRQGPDAPGGAFDYMVDDDLFGGFAVVAYPAKYGVSGIMTFMISHDGTVFESNLGPETQATVKSMDTFNPDKHWTEVPVDDSARPD